MAGSGSRVVGTDVIFCLCALFFYVKRCFPYHGEMCLVY